MRMIELGLILQKKIQYHLRHWSDIEQPCVWRVNTTHQLSQSKPLVSRHTIPLLLQLIWVVVWLGEWSRGGRLRRSGRLALLNGGFRLLARDRVPDLLDVHVRHRNLRRRATNHVFGRYSSAALRWAGVEAAGQKGSRGTMWEEDKGSAGLRAQALDTQRM